MSGAETRLAGACLCGAIRFSAVPLGNEVHACHCETCRRWAAGPLMAIPCGGSVRIDDDTDLGVYRSSAWAERCFCRKCGTSLFWRTTDGSVWMAAAFTLDDPGGRRLAIEMFIDEKPPHYAFANDTTKMTGAEVFAAFAAGQGSENG